MAQGAWGVMWYPGATLYYRKKLAAPLYWLAGVFLTWANRVDGPQPRKAKAFPVKDYDYGLSPARRAIIDAAVKTVLARKKERAEP